MYDPKTDDSLILYKCIFSDSTIAVYYGKGKYTDEDTGEVFFGEFVEGFKIIENGIKLNMTNPTEGELGTLGKDSVNRDYLYTFTLKVN